MSTRIVEVGYVFTQYCYGEKSESYPEGTDRNVSRPTGCFCFHGFVAMSHYKAFSIPTPAVLQNKPMNSEL